MKLFKLKRAILLWTMVVMVAFESIAQVVQPGKVMHRRQKQLLLHDMGTFQ